MSKHPGQAAREAKDKNPEQFCMDKKCLWRIRDRNGKYLGPCKSTKHVHYVDTRSTE